MEIVFYRLHWKFLRTVLIEELPGLLGLHDTLSRKGRIKRIDQGLRLNLALRISMTLHIHWHGLIKPLTVPDKGAEVSAFVGSIRLRANTLCLN